MENIAGNSSNFTRDFFRNFSRISLGGSGIPSKISTDSHSEIPSGIPSMIFRRDFSTSSFWDFFKIFFSEILHLLLSVFLQELLPRFFSKYFWDFLKNSGNFFWASVKNCFRNFSSNSFLSSFGNLFRDSFVNSNRDCSGKFFWNTFIIILRGYLQKLFLGFI